MSSYRAPFSRTNEWNLNNVSSIWISVWDSSKPFERAWNWSENSWLANIESLSLLLTLCLKWNSHDKYLFNRSSLREKCQYLEFFWSVFSCIRTECSVSLCIQSECGKTGTRKAPNTDTFHAVSLQNIFFIAFQL